MIEYKSAQKLTAAETYSTSRYEMIYYTMREAIIDGRAQKGLVLLEAPLAKLFGTSRAPVRQALEWLNKDKLIQRFDGRGYVINKDGTLPVPIRAPLSSETLGLNIEQTLIDNRSLSERIYDEMASSIVNFIAFGHYQIDEQSAIDYFNVSRNIINEALIRLANHGYVAKNPYERWFAGPLMAKSVAEDYDLRAILEPNALKESAPLLSKKFLLTILKKIILCQENLGKISLEQLNSLEKDIHLHCLNSTQNNKMMHIITNCQGSMHVHYLFRQSIQQNVDVTMLNEHRTIVESLLYQPAHAAANHLHTHIINAKKRALQRLKVLAVLPEPIEPPPYLIRIS